MQITSLERDGEETEREPNLTAEALIARYLTRVHRFATMVSPRGVEPEDLAQQALLRALEAIDRFDPRKGTLDAWLWRIVVNVGRDAGRVIRRRELVAERLVRDHPNAAAASAETLAFDQMRDLQLLAVVRELPRRYRSLIALRYGAGLSSEETANALGTSRMAVAKATRRALDKLRASWVTNEVEP